MTHTLVHAEDIHYETRQRKEFKDKPLADLAESILRVGLIHAPVITTGGVLVAGERRLRALAITEGRGSFRYGDGEFTYPEIPVNIVPTPDPRLLFEIELEENLRRVNLTPMEEAAAISALHHLRLEDHPEQTKKDTAKEIATLAGKPEAKSVDEVKVANSILVEAYKDDPEVQKAAKVSLNKAAKVAKKKMEIELIKSIQGLDGSKTARYSMFMIYPGDCLEIMRSSFKESTFDILFFDPPYGVDADKFGEQAHDLGHQYKDDWASAKKLITEILQIGKQVLKPDCHVLMFLPFETFNYWSKVYDSLGFKVWPRPLIWSKGQQAHALVPDYGPRYSYECVLFAARGKRKINKLVNDVFSIPAVRDKIHAAEKPSELLANLIDFVARPGDSILDPTCGSGSIFTAAKGKEIYVTGIELEPNAFAVARERAK